ncbi:unnamed protein product [Parascedosporium putredinis]|uniref:Uncharacterized protein n=1 Tax=Parascedosporium putredinis TaxID=1442378 RepID=A0A9P1MDG4_9PEZI|nr:unnamed protein product [Parascedosporium putredinis]CAI8002513.1 unnamed protein product [Parascedosporium putredinis]
MLAVSCLLILSIAARWAAAECYLPNGVDRNQAKSAGSFYERCNNATDVSMCCNTGLGDICRENGLCFNPNTEQVWRESCTDPTWKSPSCLKLCVSDILNSEGVAMLSTDIMITICTDGSLCCGSRDVTEDCCRDGSGFVIKDGEVVAASQDNSSPDDKSSSGPDKAVIIGAVLGSVLGVVLIVLAALFIRRKRRGRKPRPCRVPLMRRLTLPPLRPQKDPRPCSRLQLNYMRPRNFK